MDFLPDTWAEVLAAIGVVAGLFAGLRWLVRDVVRQEVSAFTRPIQPGYRNGGESLADVAHRMKRIETHLGIEEA